MNAEEPIRFIRFGNRSASRKNAAPNAFLANPRSRLTHVASCLKSGAGLYVRSKTVVIAKLAYPEPPAADAE